MRRVFCAAPIVVSECCDCVSGSVGEGFGSHAAGCGNRHVTLPATREESCCYPRGVSKAVSTTLPRLCQVPGLDHLLWDHSSPTATVLEGRWVTKEPGVDEEVVTRQVWVLPCSDVSSGVVVQRSQQWSFRQTWARVPSLWYPATSLGGPARRPVDRGSATRDLRALFGKLPLFAVRKPPPLWRALVDDTPSLRTP